MIKKLVAILMLLVYMPAIAGIGFSSHFCGGQYKSTNVFSFSKQACCCENPAEDDCCSDQIEIIKLEKDQLTGSSRISVKQLSQIAEFCPPVYFTIADPSNFSFSGANTFYSPPLLSKNISIIYCTFLI